MKKSFTVKFPVKQEFSSGLSWAQINQKSWVDINLLSWREITALARRYLDYPVRFTKELSNNVLFTI